MNLSLKRVAPYLGLTLLTTAVFGQTLFFQFINYDDPLYVGVLSRMQFSSLADAVGWAFTYTESGDWQPLTWISWMLDKKIYGMNPSGYHFTNFSLHLAVVCLLFLFMRRATGSSGKSFLVAALFAVHPMRVESVAWVAERKDLLSAFWMMATLCAYVRYVELRSKHGSRLRLILSYAAVLLLYGLGLLSKPMLVTLPVLMLLLDYWPLGRWNKSEGIKDSLLVFTKAVIEKMPMFLMAGASVIMTLTAIREIDPFLPTIPVAMPLRIENAITGYLTYARKLFWPYPMTFFYPRPDNFNPGFIFLCGLILILLTLFILFHRNKRPYLAVSWFWFLIVLTPVSGIIHMARAGTADRYSYFAHMGLLIGVVWLTAEILPEFLKKRRRVLFLLSALLLFSYAAYGSVYCATWKNSKSLYRHAIKVAGNNYRAHNNLGVLLMDSGELEDARKHFRESIRIEPTFGKGFRNMGLVNFKMENREEAFKYFDVATKMLPDDILTHKALGLLYTERDEYNLAIAHFEISLKFDEDPNPEIYYKLGNLYRSLQNYGQAIKYYEQMLEKRPLHVSTHNNLAGCYIFVKNKKKALEHYKMTLRIDPGHKNANKMIKQLQVKNSTEQS